MTVPPSQPPVPPQQPAQPAQGTIRLTIQGSVMTANAITPRVRINGYPVPSRYGVQDLQVYAGPNHIDIDAQWMRTYGQAGIDTTVAPGEVVEVWYASPLHQFAAGNIGFSKQPRPAMGCIWAMLGVFALLVAIIVLGAVFAS